MQAIVTSEAPPPNAEPPSGAAADEPESDDSDGDGSTAVTALGDGLAFTRACRRTRMPFPKPLGRGFSVWSILKNMIGKVGVGRLCGRHTLAATTDKLNASHASCGVHHDYGTTRQRMA